MRIIPTDLRIIMNSYEGITKDFGLVLNKRWKVTTTSDLPDINYGKLVIVAIAAGRPDHAEIFTAMQVSIAKNTYCDKKYAPSKEWSRKNQDAKKIKTMIKSTVAGMDSWVIGRHDSDYFGTINRKIRNQIVAMLIQVVVQTGTENSRKTYLCGTPYCCDLNSLCAGKREVKDSIVPSTIIIGRKGTIICEWKRFGKYFVRSEVVTLANRIIISNSHNRLSWRDDNVSYCFCKSDVPSRTTHYSDRCDFVHYKDFIPLSKLDGKLTEFELHLYHFMTKQVLSWRDQYFPQTAKAPKKKFLKGPTGRDAPDLFPE